MQRIVTRCVSHREINGKHGFMVVNQFIEPEVFSYVFKSQDNFEESHNSVSCAFIPVALLLFFNRTLYLTYLNFN